MAFDWFKLRTATKLPGSYHSPFWDTLLFQATVGEKAVWHTALALGAFHRTRILHAEDCVETSIDYLPTKESKFMLQHYISAISELRRLLSNKDKASYRVALVICIMFTTLDFLRGHLKAAQMHLRNGLKILGELQGCSSRINSGVTSPLTHSTGQEDGWISEAYSRLHLQMQLWKPIAEKPLFSLSDSLLSIPTRFQTLPKAWQGWEGIMNQILTLTEEARLQTQTLPSLIEQRECIRSALDRWLKSYQSSDLGLLPVSAEKADALIRAYHSMATIMVEVCLDPGDEMIYDSQTSRFLDMLSHLLRLLSGHGAHTIHGLSEASSSRSKFEWSIVDFGNIQALYYMAVKCRVHRIRLQAIRLLELCSHREGIWDSKAAGCVARKVMNLEEQRSWHSELDDDFPILGYPDFSEISEPTIPVSQRICDAEIEMEGSPMNTILLFGHESGKRVVISKYDCASMEWEDSQVSSRRSERRLIPGSPGTLSLSVIFDILLQKGRFNIISNV
uniref:Transcription factor domain-containing protein n=1 Tax=Bionectria ochroleuca TaxID=29856 RepID=A0A8H7K117_BIOOC